MINEQKLYANDKQRKDTYFQSALSGDGDSLTNFLKILTYNGESPLPYLREIANSDNNAWSRSYLEDQEHKVQQYIHDTFINKFKIEDIAYKLELNVPNLAGHIDYSTEGVIYIKSPQMTWKTQSLKELMKLIPDAFRVILIGHRKSLLRKTAKDLKLDLYLDVQSESKGHDAYEYSGLKNTKRLAITWHSLYKIASSPLNKAPIPTFDIVIFDECDQMFLDFYTAGKEMTYSNKAFTDRILETLVVHSDLTVCLDADISDITRKAMEDYTSLDETRHFFYINKFPVFRGYKFTFINSSNYWDRMCKLLDDDEILYITCENKGEGWWIKFPSTKGIHLNLKDAGYEGIAIHRDNYDEYIEILEQPNDVVPSLINGTSSLCKKYGIKKLQYLITSPTLETGWSCGEIGEEHTFTKTFGLFPGAPRKHYTVHSIRQAVRRARCVKDHYIYINQKDKAPKDIGKILEYLNTKGRWKKDFALARDIDVKNALSIASESPFDLRYLSALQHEELCQSNRYIHAQLLFQEFGGKIVIDHKPGQLKEPRLAPEERQQLIDENVRKIVDAQELTWENYKDIKNNNTEANKILKAKYDVRRSFHYWSKDRDDVDNRPEIPPHLIRRWANGDIKKYWKLREIAYRMPTERDLMDLPKALADKNYPDVTGHLLDIFYRTLGVKNDDVFNQPEGVVLFEWNIPDDTVEFLTQQSIIDAMNWQGTFGDKNTTNMDALTFFSRVARALDMRSKLFQPYDPDLNEIYRHNYKVNEEQDLVAALLDKAKAFPRQDGKLRGVYKKMQQRKVTQKYMEDLYFNDFNLYKGFRGIKGIGTAYLRYTNRHLVIDNYKTYPTGIFPDLAQFDMRGDKHRRSFGLNQGITEPEWDYQEDNIVKNDNEEGIYDI